MYAHGPIVKIAISFIKKQWAFSINGVCEILMPVVFVAIGKDNAKLPLMGGVVGRVTMSFQLF